MPRASFNLSCFNFFFKFVHVILLSVDVKIFFLFFIFFINCVLPLLPRANKELLDIVPSEPEIGNKLGYNHLVNESKHLSIAEG